MFDKKKPIVQLSILSPLCTLRIAGLFLEAAYSKQADRSQTSQVK